MDLSTNLNDSFKYPFIDFEKFLVLGALFLLANIASIASAFGLYNNPIYTYISVVALILSIIVSLIIGGYALSVTKTASNLSNAVPDLDFVENLVLGIKGAIVAFVYMIIPSAVVIILSVLFGATAIFSGSLDHLTSSSASSLIFGIMLIVIAGIILFVLFGIFEVVALGRLAKTDSLGEALTFEVFEDVKKIGFFKVLGWLILMGLIIGIISFILSFLLIIPFIGIIIFLFLYPPFAVLFSSRSLGLLYSVV